MVPQTRYARSGKANGASLNWVVVAALAAGSGSGPRIASPDASRRRRPGLQHPNQRYFGDGSSFGASCAFQSTGPVSKRRFNWASDHALPP